MTKKEARKDFLKKRQALSAGELFTLNQQLYNRFFAHFDLSFIKTFHIFLSIEIKNEPDTWSLLDRIRREFPHVRLVVPKINANNNLEHIYFEGLHQLEVNSWGIAEPKQGVPAEENKIDAVLVPLLVCDKQGNRVGYGKGFYDQFLARCRTDCQKIGYSFFDPIDSLDDVDRWDVRLDGCITPSTLHRFTNHGV